MGITKFRHSLSSGIFLKTILLGIAAIFVVGCFSMFGGQWFGSKGGKSSSGYAVKVNGESIPLEYFNNRLQSESERIEKEQDSSPMASQIAGITADLLNRTIMLTALRQAAEDKGIRVGRGDINEAIDKGVEQTMSEMRLKMAAGIESFKKKKPSKSEVDRELEVRLQQAYEDRSLTLASYEEKLRSSMDREEVKNSLIIQKLRETLERSARGMSDRELIDNYREVSASRILIEARIGPKGQAEHQANDILKQLKSGADFTRLARERSDDPMTKKAGGAFPAPLTRGLAQAFGLDPALVKAIFVLRPGQISDVIRTRDGYEIVKVTAEKSSLPKDFQAKKRQYMNDALQGKRMQIVREFETNTLKSAKVEIGPPELEGYWAMQQAGMAASSGGQEAYKKAIARAAALFEKAIQENPNDAAAIYSLSQAYLTLSKPENALRLLEIKLNNPDAPSVETADLRMLLGDLYIGNKDSKRALDQYVLASQVGIAIDSIHQLLVPRFKDVGRKDLAAKEQEYVDMAKAQAGGGSTVPAGSPAGAPGR
ncbi:MAG: peptidylprolyl isomerase [Armatimonadota bacterium]|nr:peptidylprolyl isomerase [Armatimonadota bacterium]